MNNNNTRQVNIIVSNTMLACSFVFILMIIFNHFGIFDFNRGLKYTIQYLGLFVTVSPSLLRIPIFKVSENCKKYYMLIVLAAYIGYLGTFTGIGIYISYILVPIVSCLYFDRKLTMISGIFSYLMMAFGVWNNTMSRWETVFLGWDHLTAFRAYMIGFSIEYVVVMAFIYQFVRRAYKYMSEQQESLKTIRADEQKYRFISEGMKDIVFEIDTLKYSYSANRSVYADNSSNSEPVYIENLDEAILEMDDSIAGILQKLKIRIREKDSISQDVNFSYRRDSKMVPLWYRLEMSVLRDDEEKTSRIIGRMRNITAVKLSDIANSKNRISEILSDSDNKRNTITSQLMKEAENFKEEDFLRMTQSRQILASLTETLRISTNADATMQAIIAKIGVYLEVDRILILQGMSENVRIGLQWANKQENILPEEFGFIQSEDIIETEKTYDEYGYIEVNPAHQIFTGHSELRPEFFDGMITNTMLGNQLWIPILYTGKYVGAVCFDRYDTTRYSVSDKFIASEVVNIVTNYMQIESAENEARAKTAYLSNMSHEIRTPMNAILGMTEVALRSKDEMTEDVRRCLETIQSSSQGLLGIINDILDFSKIEAGKIDIIPEEYNTRSLVNDVMTIAEARNADKGLDLKFHISDDLPAKLYGDSVRIKQIMLNLVNNAIKYTDKGSVDVYLNCEKGIGNDALIDFKVTDSGQGIREEDMATLFESYSQVNKEQNHHKEGTGLGLAISKQLTELMNGKMYVSSKYGIGSTFGFQVPQVIIDNDSQKTTESSEFEDEFANESLPGAKILLVDDNEINLEVAKMLFEPLKMDIETAGDGTEAVEMSKDKKYHLILMDNFMPTLNGGDATRLIRADETNPNKETPIIALTADAVSGVKEKLLEDGMNDFLPKPIDTKLAYRKIFKWIESGGYKKSDY